MASCRDGAPTTGPTTTSALRRVLLDRGPTSPALRPASASHQSHLHRNHAALVSVAETHTTTAGDSQAGGQPERVASQRPGAQDAHRTPTRPCGMPRLPSSTAPSPTPPSTSSPPVTPSPLPRPGHRRTTCGPPTSPRHPQPPPTHTNANLLSCGNQEKPHTQTPHAITTTDPP